MLVVVVVDLTYEDHDRLKMVMDNLPLVVASHYFVVELKIKKYQKEVFLLVINYQISNLVMYDDTLNSYLVHLVVVE